MLQWRARIDMSTAELRRNIKKRVDTLPPDRLQSAANFLALLEHGSKRRGGKAELFARLAEAEADVAAGRVVAVSKLR